MNLLGKVVVLAVRWGHLWPRLLLPAAAGGRRRRVPRATSAPGTTAAASTAAASRGRPAAHRGAPTARGGAPPPALPPAATTAATTRRTASAPRRRKGGVGPLSLDPDRLVLLLGELFVEHSLRHVSGIDVELDPAIAAVPGLARSLGKLHHPVDGHPGVADVQLAQRRH